jgi:hypothetical protein
MHSFCFHRLKILRNRKECALNETLEGRKVQLQMPIANACSSYKQQQQLLSVVTFLQAFYSQML